MAPPLDKINIGKLTYFKLAEFNRTVLTYNFMREPTPEIHYVTWKKVDANSYERGRYFCGHDDVLNEQQAMRDFCVRSGLIRECDLLANDKLPDFAAMIERLRGRKENYADDKLLGELQAQIHKIMNEPKEMIVDRRALINGQSQQFNEPIEL